MLLDQERPRHYHPARMNNRGEANFSWTVALIQLTKSSSLIASLAKRVVGSLKKIEVG